jgi:hypothetical protein
MAPPGGAAPDLGGRRRPQRWDPIQAGLRPQEAVNAANTGNNAGRRPTSPAAAAAASEAPPAVSPTDLSTLHCSVPWACGEPPCTRHKPPSRLPSLPDSTRTPCCLQTMSWQAAGGCPRGASLPACAAAAMCCLPVLPRCPAPQGLRMPPPHAWADIQRLPAGAGGLAPPGRPGADPTVSSAKAWPEKQKRASVVRSPN